MDKGLGMNLGSEVVSDTQDGRIFIDPYFQLEFRGIIVEDEDIYRYSLRNDVGVETITHRIGGCSLKNLREGSMIILFLILCRESSNFSYC